MSKMARHCAAHHPCASQQYPAILPWPSSLRFAGIARCARTFCPAAVPPDVTADASAIRLNLRGSTPRKTELTSAHVLFGYALNRGMICSENRYLLFGIML
jgi:hypothetical protein